MTGNLRNEREGEEEREGEREGGREREGERERGKDPVHTLYTYM